MEKYITVTDESFQGDVLDSDVPVLVDFWAPWCGPCRALAPHLDTVATEFDGRAKVAKVNVDENMQFAQQFGVQSIPRLILFKNGAPVDDLTGLPPNPVDTFRQMVNKAL